MPRTVDLDKNYMCDRRETLSSDKAEACYYQGMHERRVDKKCNDVPISFK